MKYSFSCYGHENITARHKTTLEFTKDEDLGLEGDCIIGVKADFQLKKIKSFIKKLNNNKVTIIIKPILNDYNKNNINKKIINNRYNDKIIEKINAEINPGFNSNEELVIRKSDFISERTFAIRADKAAFELDKELVGFLEERGNKIRVIVECRL